MPEITSVEAIRAKLVEFDRRMEQALAAVRILVRIKEDAKAHLEGIQRTSRKSEEAQTSAEEIRAQLNHIRGEWDGLKQEVAGAGERLAQQNRMALAAQADLMAALEASTRANADTADTARAAVVEVAGKTDGLLKTVREELGAEVRGRLSQAEDLIEKETQRVENYLEKEHSLLKESVTRQREAVQQRLVEEISSFKEEMRQGLSEHQRVIDRQLTDFLNRQNALVRNLAQQIDGFDRASEAKAADQARLATSVAEVSTGLGELRSDLESRSQTLGLLASSVEEVSVRLGRTLEKLQEIPLVGNRFK